MINYTEKGFAMHRFINDSGHWLKEQDGTWVSSDDVEVQLLIDNYNALNESQSTALNELGQYASGLIDKKIDPIKAKRIQSDALSVTVKSVGNAPLTASDADKLTALDDAMVYPNAIFAQYDIEEAAILAETDWQLIDVNAAKARLDTIV